MSTAHNFFSRFSSEVALSEECIALQRILHWRKDPKTKSKYAKKRKKVKKLEL